MTDKAALCTARRIAVALGTMLAAPPAWAAGYYYSDAGIVATGRGGAFIAGADNQFAQYYNPAGLTRIEAPTVNLGMSLVQQKIQFARMRATVEPGQSEFLPEVENQAAPFQVPQGGFAMPIGDDFAVAVGFYSPFAPSSLYDEEGPQRYTIIDTLIYQFSVGPSLAYRPIPEISVGVGVAWQYLQVGQRLDITISGNDDPLGDIGVEAEVVDAFTPGFNAGVIIDPVEQVSIGLSITPPTRFKARGEGTLDFGGTSIEDGLTKTKYVDDDIALNLDLPIVFRAGVEVRPVSGLEIEVAAVYQNWRALEDILIEDVDVEVEVVEEGLWSTIIPEDQRKVDDSFVLPAGLQDAWSFRLGGEYQIVDEVAVRAGGFYETAALADNEISVALVDPNKLQLGAGASVFLMEQRLRFDAAFAWLFFPTLEIRNSKVTQIDAGVIEGVEPLVVGNGDISSHGWVAGAQGSWTFR